MASPIDSFCPECSAQPLLRASQAVGAFPDAALGLAVDAAGNSYVTGLFGDVAVFGAGQPNETILTSAGSDDVFVAATSISLDTSETRPGSDAAKSTKRSW